MSDFSGLLSFSYGSADLDLVDVAVSSAPITSDTYRTRVGTKFSIKLTAELVQAGSAADFAAAVVATQVALTQSGQNFALKGLADSSLLNLPAAVCVNGGPHISYVSKPNGIGRHSFDITLDAETFDDGKGGGGGGGGGGPNDNFAMAVATTPDGLRRVMRSGEIRGPDTPAYFLNTVLPAFKAAYPLPRWTVAFNYSNRQEANSSSLSYEAEAQENAGLLPTAGGVNATVGEYTVTTAVDEQQRKTLVYDADFLCDGDPAALIQRLRPVGVTVFSESVAVSTVRENRLRATFRVLVSGSGSPLMNFTQTVTIRQPVQTYRIQSYPGVGPLLIRNDRKPILIEQSGQATCENCYLKPPQWVSSIHLDEPQIAFQDVNAVEKITTWRYSMVAGGAGKLADFSFKPADFSRNRPDFTFVGDNPAARKKSLDYTRDGNG